MHALTVVLFTRCSGDFNMNNDDDDDDDDNDLATTASDEMPLSSLAALNEARGAAAGSGHPRNIKRYALARDAAGQQTILENEATTHNAYLAKLNWSFQAITITPDAGSSSDVAP